MSNGDWYCPNCGYLSGARVTFHETCDTCHTPVQWHEAGVNPNVYEAAPELLAACEQMLSVWNSGYEPAMAARAQMEAAVARAKQQSTREPGQ